MTRSDDDDYWYPEPSFSVGAAHEMDAQDPARIRGIWHAKSISKAAARVFDNRIRRPRRPGFGGWS